MAFALDVYKRQTVAYLKNPDCDLTETLLAPDFPTGGELIFDADAIRDIYNTGRGSVRVRAKYRYVKDQNLSLIHIFPTPCPPQRWISSPRDSSPVWRRRCSP